MNIQLPYGHSFQQIQISDRIAVDIIDADTIPEANDPIAEVERSLNDLIGDVTWDNFQVTSSVAIAINDKTRFVPHSQLIPPLLNKLQSLGIDNGDITFYVAVGTHPPMTKDELVEIIPVNIIRKFRVLSHDSERKDNLVNLGVSSRGTPVWINRGYLQSDLKIVLGNIEPHQIAGFSGGAKSAAIGLAGRETIQHNHSLLSHPDTRLGSFSSNPVRQDIEEIGGMINIDLAVNVILNNEKKIIKTLAGTPLLVMQEGIKLSREFNQVSIDQKYKLVIASPGGHPKDINVYQAQKGLAHACLAAENEGTVLLVAACPEGSGSLHYSNWMAGKQSHAEVMEHFQKEKFQIGAHKAYLVSRDASRYHLKTFTSLDYSTANELLLNPFTDLQSDINSEVSRLDDGERIAVLPHASSIMPKLNYE